VSDRARLWFFPSTPDALNCAPPSWPLLPNCLEQTPFNSGWVVSPVGTWGSFSTYEALCQRQDVSLAPCCPFKTTLLGCESRTYLKPRYSGGRHSAECAHSNKPRGWKLVQPGRKIRWATNQAIGSNHSGTTILGTAASAHAEHAISGSLGCPSVATVVKTKWFMAVVFLVVQ